MLNLGNKKSPRTFARGLFYLIFSISSFMSISVFIRINKFVFQKGETLIGNDFHCTSVASFFHLMLIERVLCLQKLPHRDECRLNFFTWCLFTRQSILLSRLSVNKIDGLTTPVPKRKDKSLLFPRPLQDARVGGDLHKAEFTQWQDVVFGHDRSSLP